MIEIQDILLPLVTVIVVLTGIGVILLITFWPSLLGVWIVTSLQPILHEYYNELPERNTVTGVFITVVILIQMIHLRQLWTDPNHLKIFRWILLPIRRLALPLIMYVARIESIREKAPTMYYKTNHINTTREVPVSQDDLLHSVGRNVRRRYRQMEQLYKETRIEHVACECEKFLNLQEMIPILWEHQRRICHDDALIETKKNASVEFVKRFLVVTLVPDGILDLYYQSNGTEKKLVGFQLTIQQGVVLHWFMYFAKDSVSRSGIWFHGTLLAILRASNMPNVDYVNAQIHQTESKQHAGFTKIDHDDTDLLSEIYPWAWTRKISPSIIDLPLWNEQQYTPPTIDSSS
jgi:hypothetical protein